MKTSLLEASCHTRSGAAAHPLRLPLGLHQARNPHARAGTPIWRRLDHEIKHEGYRTLIVVDQGRLQAFSRHGRDWTGPYHSVVTAAAKLPCNTTLIDGELIVQDENGISDFDALRSAIPQGKTSAGILCLRSLSS
jgi:ATP-dependent DNA ligase